MQGVTLPEDVPQGALMEDQDDAWMKLLGGSSMQVVDVMTSMDLGLTEVRASVRDDNVPDILSAESIGPVESVVDDVEADFYVGACS